MPPELKYVAVRKFDPVMGREWNEYIQWVDLSTLEEIISIDNILCPTVTGELTDEDWHHNVHEDYQCWMFRDLRYLLRRIGDADLKRTNVLALLENPSIRDVQSIVDPRFEFKGYDLMEWAGGVSVLVNCAWKEVRHELSSVGLIDNLDRAYALKKRWDGGEGDPSHTPCNVWAIWKVTPLPQSA